MGSALLCETVTATTMADLVAARDAATAADMVELRLDGVEDVDVVRALQGRRMPAIVTCRPSWEGGRFQGAEDERAAILERAIEQGAEFVDVEWRALRERTAPALARLLETHRRRVVVSAHDFEGVPVDLAARARAMRSTGAGVIKLAVAAARLSDTLPLADIARDGDAVVIGMGEAGMPTRLLASRFGSRWTYGGNAVAPGQVPARCMVERFRFRDVGPRTRIYGVVGIDAVQSAAPAMYNAAFAAAGLDAVCVPLAACDADDYEAFATALGVAGASWNTAPGADEIERQIEAWKAAID